MNKLKQYNTNREKWRKYLFIWGFQVEDINRIINKLPNNQAPLSPFWMKKTVDWIAKEKTSLPQFTKSERKKLFQRYDNNHFYRYYPAQTMLKKKYINIQKQQEKQKSQNKTRRKIKSKQS